MSEITEDLKPKQPSPTCPYCNMNPMGLNVREMMFPNGLVVLLCWCGNPECQKLITASFRGQAEPNIRPPGPMRIIRPD